MKLVRRAPPSEWALAIKAMLLDGPKRAEPRASIAPTFAVGFIGALWAVLSVTAYASFIFSGPLAPALLIATSAMLTGYAVAALVIALGSRVPGMIATAVSSSAVVYAAAVSSLDGQLVHAGLDDTVARASLALLMCGLTTAVGGLALWLVGALRAGAAAQLLPYPVVSGYHAGLGGLFIVGGMAVATGLAPHSVVLDGLGPPLPLLQAGACCALGLFILYLPQRLRCWWVMPGLLLGSTLAFHAIRMGWRTDLDAARMAGWLLGPFPHSAAPPGLSVLSPSSFSLVGWSVVYAWAPFLASNRRCSCIAGGAASRFGALVPALSAVAVLLVGLQVMELIPRFVFGALLFSFGVERLLVRLGQDCFMLPRHEAAIALAVAGCTLWFGVVNGLLIGVGLAILLFAWNYRHVPIIRASLSGRACRSSSVDRSSEAIGVLDREGESILLHRCRATCSS